MREKRSVSRKMKKNNEPKMRSISWFEVDRKKKSEIRFFVKRNSCGSVASVSFVLEHLIKAIFILNRISFVSHFVFYIFSFNTTQILNSTP